MRPGATRCRSPIGCSTPSVEYWYGRFDVDHDRRDEGRARLKAALDGFTAREMVLHLALAERALAETA